MENEVKHLLRTIIYKQLLTLSESNGRPIAQSERQRIEDNIIGEFFRRLSESKFKILNVNDRV